jgi:hypothetical protein
MSRRETRGYEFLRARSKETQQLETVAAKVPELERELAAKGKELAVVRKDLNRAQTQIRETSSKAAGRSQESCTTRRMHLLVVLTRMSLRSSARNSSQHGKSSLIFEIYMRRWDARIVRGML